MSATYWTLGIFAVFAAFFLGRVPDLALRRPR